MHTVKRNGSVEGQRETKKLVKNAELNAGAPFQKPAEGERDKKSRDENNDRQARLLRLEQREKQLLDYIKKAVRRNKFSSRSTGRDVHA
jgi:hypothetical protein